MDITVDACRRVSRSVAASVGVLIALGVSSATADSVEDMCHKSNKICACAAGQLKSDVGDDDYSLYEAVGAAYLANQASGMKMEEAWDAAVRAEASRRGVGFFDILGRTNAVGKAHRKAIKACAD